MVPRPPRSTRTDTLFPYTTLFRSLGPTLSFRGLDNAAYYRLQPGHKRFYVNDTGCGNTLNVAHPYVLRLVLDSLRWWVEAMGVDGFRSEERRVGKECVSTCRSRWSPYP